MTVEENVGVVSLQLVAIGAEIGTPFTVQVDSRESVPPSARGVWGKIDGRLGRVVGGAG